MAFRSVPRPSSPPGAKASTECPSYTRYPGLVPEGASLTMHRNHPRHPHLCEPMDDPGNIHSAHSQDFTGSFGTSIAYAISDLPDPIKSFTTPLNPRRRPLGRRSCERQFPVRHTTERRDPPSVRRPNLSRTRPETHQNLIHTDKDQHGRQGGRSNGAFARRGRIAPAHQRTELEHSAIQTRLPRLRTPPTGGDDRDRTGDPLLAKQVLSQLSYAPNLGNFT